MNITQEVARALLEINAVGFSPHAPVTFKSGIKSPVYVDNRRLPYHPPQWRRVIYGFASLIDDLGLPFDALAGLETAGIPHSSALAYQMERPAVYVRKSAKEHGLHKMVEGGDVRGKTILLIEDLVTTGESCLAGIAALRAAGAIVHDCFAIVSYGFAQKLAAFKAANVRLHKLTTFPIILDHALKMGKFTAADKVLIEDWLNDPYGWAARHGF
ncbi:MAG: orotate phosphoribosyltransferase [Chloroflexi bacterium]|nr:orotate phosphoribosyltransferase [Chloroflexota bacterium]